MPFTINLPEHLSLWLIWIVLFTLSIFFASKLRRIGNKAQRMQLVWMAGLSLLMLASPFLARLTLDLQLILPSADPEPLEFLFLAAIPWLAAVGLVGILPALALALASGLLQAGFFTHDLFTPLFYMYLVLAFAWLSAKVHYRKADTPLFPPFFGAFLALILNLALIFVVKLLPSTGSLYERLQFSVMATWKTALPLLVSVLIGGLVCQLLGWFLPTHWRPLRLLREHPPRNALTNAIFQIERLLGGDFQEPAERPSYIGIGRELQKSLASLRQKLRDQADVQYRLRSLENAHEGDKTFEETLSTILRACLGHGAVSARMLLLEKEVTGDKKALRLRQGQGRMNRNYAYLDTTILQHLPDTGNLILSDIKISQVFGLPEDNPYPKALIAFALGQGETQAGALWIGFEENRWFSQEDIDYYEILKKRASSLIQTSAQIRNTKNQRDQYVSMLDSIPDMLLFFDEEMRLVYANQAARDSQDLLLKAGTGKKLGEVIPYEDIISLVEKATEQPQAKTINLRNREEFEVISMRMKLPAGWVICTLRDTTHLRTLNAQKTEFVTNVSHDLRSPLVLMKGYANMVQNIGNLSEQQQMYMQRIHGSIESMSRLVNNILSLERLDAGEAMQYTQFALNELIEASLETVRVFAKQRKVTLEVDHNELDQLILEADRILLQQALFNLLDNAIKYSAIGGTVELILSKNTNKLRFEIKDQGAGIAPLDIPKLFNRYFHLEPGFDQPQKGHGLGLAIVRSIVERHNGKVWVNSQLGKGSSFFIEIPISPIL